MSYAEPFIATRWSLLSRLRNLDDQASWQDFFNTYWKLIYGVALKAGLNDAEAQDVVQETVLTVVRKLPGFKTDPRAGSFKGWLLHIVRWRVADQFRRQQRQDRWLARTDAETDATPTLERIPDPAGFNLERIWDEEWEKNLVDVALERIKDRVNPGLYQMFDLYVVSQVDVLQVGRNDAAGYFYYIMELADSMGAVPTASGSVSVLADLNPDTYSPRTLQTELAARGRLPFEECLRIGLSLTKALTHLHQHGLTHRDIKPSNIVFIGGVAKLADIGLVADAGARQSFVGTMGFLPPEGPGTPRADLYSLGKVLYEISFGRDRKEFPELPTASNCSRLVT